jgi:hypothetical protein
MPEVAGFRVIRIGCILSKMEVPVGRSTMELRVPPVRCRIQALTATTGRVVTKRVRI